MVKLRESDDLLDFVQERAPCAKALIPLVRWLLADPAADYETLCQWATISLMIFDVAISNCLDFEHSSLPCDLIEIIVDCLEKRKNLWRLSDWRPCSETDNVCEDDSSLKEEISEWLRIQIGFLINFSTVGHEELEILITIDSCRRRPTICPNETISDCSRKDRRYNGIRWSSIFLQSQYDGQQEKWVLRLLSALKKIRVASTYCSLEIFTLLSLEEGVCSGSNCYSG